MLKALCVTGLALVFAGCSTTSEDNTMAGAMAEASVANFSLTGGT